MPYKFTIDSGYVLLICLNLDLKRFQNPRLTAVQINRLKLHEQPEWRKRTKLAKIVMTTVLPHDKPTAPWSLQALASPTTRTSSVVGATSSAYSGSTHPPFEWTCSPRVAPPFGSQCRRAGPPHTSALGRLTCPACAAERARPGLLATVWCPRWVLERGLKDVRVALSALIDYVHLSYI